MGPHHASSSEKQPVLKKSQSISTPNEGVSLGFLPTLGSRAFSEPSPSLGAADDSHSSESAAGKRGSSVGLYETVSQWMPFTRSTSVRHSPAPRSHAHAHGSGIGKQKRGCETERLPPKRRRVVHRNSAAAIRQQTDALGIDSSSFGRRKTARTKRMRSPNEVTSSIGDASDSGTQQKRSRFGVHSAAETESVTRNPESAHYFFGGHSAVGNHNPSTHVFSHSLTSRNPTSARVSDSINADFSYLAKRRRFQGKSKSGRTQTDAQSQVKSRTARKRRRRSSSVGLLDTGVPQTDFRRPKRSRRTHSHSQWPQFSAKQQWHYGDVQKDRSKDAANGSAVDYGQHTAIHRRPVVRGRRGQGRVSQSATTAFRNQHSANESMPASKFDSGLQHSHLNLDDSENGTSTTAQRRAAATTHSPDFDFDLKWTEDDSSFERESSERLPSELDPSWMTGPRKRRRLVKTTAIKSPFRPLSASTSPRLSASSARGRRVPQNSGAVGNRLSAGRRRLGQTRKRPVTEGRSDVSAFMLSPKMAKAKSEGRVWAEFWENGSAVASDEPMRVRTSPSGCRPPVGGSRDSPSLFSFYKSPSPKLRPSADTTTVSGEVMRLATDRRQRLTDRKAKKEKRSFALDSTIEKFATENRKERVVDKCTSRKSERREKIRQWRGQLQQKSSLEKTPFKFEMHRTRVSHNSANDTEDAVGSHSERGSATAKDRTAPSSLLSFFDGDAELATANASEAKGESGSGVKADISEVYLSESSSDADESQSESDSDSDDYVFASGLQQASVSSTSGLLPKMAADDETEQMRTEMSDESKDADLEETESEKPKHESNGMEKNGSDDIDDGANAEGKCECESTAASWVLETPAASAAKRRDASKRKAASDLDSEIAMRSALRLKELSNEKRRVRNDEALRCRIRDNEVMPLLKRRVRLLVDKPLEVLREFCPKVRIGRRPTAGAVQRAFKRGLATFHPDTCVQQSPRRQVEAEEVFKLLAAAKEDYFRNLNN